MPKIAFLFLIISTIYHENYWNDFFKGHEQHYSIYIHAKESMPNTAPFKQHEIQTKVPTLWSRTMRAQIELLKAALHDPDNTKFVFVSENSIPLQNFDTVYTVLTSTNKSIFPYYKSPHHDPNYSNYEPRRILKPLPTDYQYKNAQWVILNRTHAQLMADDTLYTQFLIDRFSDQEHYPSTLLAIKGLLNENEVINKDTTYVNWEKQSKVPGSHPVPYYFYDMNDPEDYNIILKVIKDGFLFARKFTKDCDLSPLDKHLRYRAVRSSLPQMPPTQSKK